MTTHSPTTPAIRRARDAEAIPRDLGAVAETVAADMVVYLVVKRRPLSEKPALWRWLARLVYARIGWSSDFGVEYQGVYTDEAEARHAASGIGMSYTSLPLNTCLPDETCQFQTHDFPLSEASSFYRNRKLGFVAVPHGDVDKFLAVGPKIEQLNECLNGTKV